MQNVLNPLSTVYQTQLEASRRFADAMFSGTEKIDRVFLAATQRAFNEQLNFAQAIATARDPKSVGTTLQSSFMSRNPDEVVNYQKEIMRIFAEMQNEIGRSMQDYVEQLKSQATRSVTLPLAAVQNQANDAFNPVTSMFSVWESAFKEVADLAKKNMAVARSSVEATANKTVESVGHYANTGVSNMQDVATSAVDRTVNVASHAAKMASTAVVEEDEKRGSSLSGSSRRK